MQTLGETFDDNFTYLVNAEDATVQARYKLETPWLIDGSVGVHVWKKKVGVVVGVTRTSGSTPASIVAQIPHPFFDNQQREVSGEADFLERAETAAHVDLYYLATSGKLRLLVTWGAQRTKRWPNTPTLKELGYPIVSNSPYGIAGPKGMDPATVKALHDAFKKALEDPEYQKTLEKFDQEAFYLNSPDYAALAKKTFDEEREIVKRLGLKM